MKLLTFLKSRFSGLYILSVIFLAVSFALRTALCIRSAADADFTFPLLAKIYAVGLLFDFATCFYCSVPLFLYLLFISDKTFKTKINRRFLTGLYLVLLCAILFDVFAEWLFWGEFDGRFNFVAIDYFTYPRQIIRNIIESYPVAPLFAVLFAATAVLFLITRKYYFLTFKSVGSFRQRLKSNLPYLIVPLLSPFFIDISLADVSTNHYADELAKNGVYTLFAAFRNNVLDYEKSYITQDNTVALTHLKELLKTDNSAFISDNAFDITRQVDYPAPEKRYNVIVLRPISMPLHPRVFSSPVFTQPAQGPFAHLKPLLYLCRPPPAVRWSKGRTTGICFLSVLCSSSEVTKQNSSAADAATSTIWTASLRKRASRM